MLTHTLAIYWEIFARIFEDSQRLCAENSHFARSWSGATKSLYPPTRLWHKKRDLINLKPRRKCTRQYYETRRICVRYSDFLAIRKWWWRWWKGVKKRRCLWWKCVKKRLLSRVKELFKLCYQRWGYFNEIALTCLQFDEREATITKRFVYRGRPPENCC